MIRELRREEKEREREYTPLEKGSNTAAHKHGVKMRLDSRWFLLLLSETIPSQDSGCETGLFQQRKKVWRKVSESWMGYGQGLVRLKDD